jgi:hypothetical protein
LGPKSKDLLGSLRYPVLVRELTGLATDSSRDMKS